MESTLDEANDAADMIAMKYIGQTPEADGPLSGIVCKRPSFGITLLCYTQMQQVACLMLTTK